MQDYNLPPIPFYMPSWYAMDYNTPLVEDADYIDITDIQEEEPGEEAYCVPI